MTSEERPRFVVQRHRATADHFDFRIEVGDVLVSWAVPKGLTLDPKRRRTAFKVGDHPLEYFDFEGVIPKGQYGGGTVMLWDRGTWLPLEDDPHQAIRKGKLKFEMRGENYAAILRAVETGQLVRTAMRDGFMLFTRGSLSKRQLAGRVRVGGQVVDQYIAEQRAAARPMLIGIWAALALLLPGLYLGVRTVLSRRSQPLTAPPVRPEMM